MGIDSLRSILARIKTDYKAEQTVSWNIKEIPPGVELQLARAKYYEDVKNQKATGSLMEAVARNAPKILAEMESVTK